MPYVVFQAERVKYFGFWAGLTDMLRVDCLAYYFTAILWMILQVENYINFPMFKFTFLTPRNKLFKTLNKFIDWFFLFIFMQTANEK